jgi:hypothetical protein
MKINPNCVKKDLMILLFKIILLLILCSQFFKRPYEQNFCSFDRNNISSWLFLLALNDFIALQGGGNKATDGGLGDVPSWDERYALLKPVVDSGVKRPLIKIKLW